MIEHVKGPDQVTAEWLSHVLAEAGVSTGARVLDCEQQSIGTGQVGESVRYSLNWSEDDPRLPRSVVGKFPSTSETSRAAAAATGTYVREVGFYRDVRSMIQTRTPEPYFVAEDRPANSFVLIMEDITPAAQGDQIAGCGVDAAKLALRAAADLHGPTWGRDLDHFDWLELPDPDRMKELSQLYAALFPAFEARYRDALDSDHIAIGAWMGQNLEALGMLRTGELCLTHRDFRLDNMLFSVHPDQAPLTVVDWQTAAIGRGVSDIAYFLGAGLLPDVRQQEERGLVGYYAACLSKHDVEIDVEDLWAGYRLESFAGYLMAVVASQMVEQTERGDAMFLTMASRHATQMLDLQIQELVES